MAFLVAVRVPSCVLRCALPFTATAQLFIFILFSFSFISFFADVVGLMRQHSIALHSTA